MNLSGRLRLFYEVAAEHHAAGDLMVFDGERLRELTVFLGEALALAHELETPGVVALASRRRSPADPVVVEQAPDLEPVEEQAPRGPTTSW